MALTRKMLKAMGIDEEKIDQIIEAHTETTDGLKADAARFKADADRLPALQRALDKANETIKAAGDSGFAEKYQQVRKEFDDYKAAQSAKETHAAKETAYRALLREAGVSEARLDAVLRVSDVDAVELIGGKIKDAEKLTESLKTEWKDFIVTTKTQGADTASPPAVTAGGTMTRDEIMSIKDRSARRAAIAANMNVFEKGE